MFLMNSCHFSGNNSPIDVGDVTPYFCIDTCDITLILVHSCLLLNVTNVILHCLTISNIFVDFYKYHITWCRRTQREKPVSNQ